MFALNRAKSVSSRAIQFAISSGEKARGSGSFAPLARRRAARKSINSCFCSGDNASAAASISASVLITANYTSVSRGRKEERRALRITEAKPLINANGREWKRIKRGCFTVVHRERESPPSPLLIGVHSRSLAVFFRRERLYDLLEARIAAERVPEGKQL